MHVTARRTPVRGAVPRSAPPCVTLKKSTRQIRDSEIGDANYARRGSLAAPLVSGGGGNVGGGSGRMESSLSSLNGEAARESGAAIGSSLCRHVGRLATSYDEKDDRATAVLRTARLRCL